MIKLSATMTVRLIVEDVLTMFPQTNYIEKMAVNEFRARLNRLTEKQNEQILDKVRKRLALPANI